ncbi:peptidase M49 [candidate division KSB1 bacterium]|nr:peptidase M49 [candidate division KSB1 bacterium]
MVKKFFRINIFILFIFLLFFGCARREKPRQYLLERLGDVAFAQLYADGFEELSLNDKILAYHLYQAALAGRDIAYDQNHRHALEIRDMMEEIVTHSGGIDSTLMDKITAYLKLFWVHTGNYDSNISRKFVPDFIFDELYQAAWTALGNGADLGAEDEKGLNDKLRILERTLFDPNYEPIQTNKSPHSGEDLLTGSANNFYEGVTLEEVDNYPERYPLNSRVVKVDGVIAEQVYRAGNDTVPPGLYAEEISRIIDHLEDALLYANPKQREALGHLIDYYRTGDPEDFRKYNIAWVADSPPVETINGFIEVYMDPRARKGEYEGLVGFVDPDRSRLMRTLVENAAYFERKAPWAERYKKKEFHPPVAKAYQVIMGTGDAGPLCMAGINLPNDEEIRENYGCKNFFLANVMDAFRGVSQGRVVDEFHPTPEEVQLLKDFGADGANALIAMHEVVGHGSGRVADTLRFDPDVYLKEYASTVEEARADLCALWHIFDDTLMALGVIPDPRCAEAAARRYVRNDLLILRGVPEGDQLEEDHDRGQHLIVNYLMEETGAVEPLKKDGKIYLYINDLKRFHQGVGELLIELQRIKAEGDYQAIKKLVNSYGVKFDPVWRDEVIGRVKAIDLPRYTAMVMPRLNPVRNKFGTITDVKISYPMDFMTQMLEFSGKREPQPIYNYE